MSARRFDCLRGNHFTKEPWDLSDRISIAPFFLGAEFFGVHGCEVLSGQWSFGFHDVVRFGE